MTSIFEKKDTDDRNDTDEKIIFNQGYDSEIIHNAFFVLPPKLYLNKIKQKEYAPISQSDIFATILDLMDIPKPSSEINGFSLLKEIPKNRLRISTGFVVTNDNVPEAQVTLPDESSYFIDFNRKSISYSKDKSVSPFETAPREIRELFKDEKLNNSGL